MNAPLFVAAAIFACFIIVFMYYRFIRKPKRLQRIYEQILAGDTRNSIRDLKAIIIKGGGSVDTHYLLAECYRREHNYQMAVVEYRYCVNTGKKPALSTEKDIRQGLVECYLALGKEDDALQELFALIQLEPKNAEYLYRIAKIFYDRGNLEQAVTYFDRTVKADPFHALSLSYLGMIMFHVNQIKESLVYLTRAIKADPRNFRAFYYLGRVYMEGKDFIKAITYFDSAQLSPEYRIRTLIQKGICYREMEETNSAIEEFKKAISAARGKDVNLLLTAKYALGDLYEKNGKLAEAIEQWEDIHRLKPSYRDVPEKLDKYQTLRADDNMKDFLVSSTPVFESICANIAEHLGFTVLDIKHIGTSIATIVASPKTGIVRNPKQQRVYIKIYRDAINLGVDAMKTLVEEAKVQRCGSAVCISPVKFRSDANEFTVARQVRLVDGEELAKILAEIKESHPQESWEG
jgi:tetratricopeptide (TPR) repeat protein